MSQENENTDTGVEEENKGLHDAMSAAVDELVVTPKQDDEDDNDQISNSDDAAGSESGDDESGNEEDESGQDAADADDSADDVSDEDADEGDDASEEADKDGDSEDDGDESGREPDPINDPIPETLNKRTQARIQSLIETAKEKTQLADQGQEILQSIQATGATPEQYAGSLTVLRLYNSDSADDKRKALEIVRGMERDLALELGEAGSHVNLEEYPDLLADVEAGDLSEKRALELAAVRARDKHVETKRSTQREQQTQKQQTQQLVERGKSDLDALGQELMSDPAYKQVYPQFTALLNTTLRNVHPTEWKATAKQIFEQLKVNIPVQSISPAGGNPPAKKRPLRPKSGSTGDKKSDADSALDAINGAIQGM